MIVPSFNYRIDAQGVVTCADDEGTSARTARLVVEGIQRTQAWLGHFGQAERDLLRVASAVLDADRLSLRRPVCTKETKRELYWRRRLNVVISLENPTRWNAAISELHTVLAFLTDDDWNISFEQAPRFGEQQPLFPPDLSREAEIALFSGGLDSALGMRARHLKNGGSFIAVSAVGNDVRRQAQATALKTLLNLGVPVTAVSVVHQLRRDSKRSRRSMESTQRTRGLLFLAMGAAVASAIGNDRFHVYETGLGGLNVPTSAAQIASQGTRAMHPLTLARFNNLLTRVFDRSVSVVAPFFFMTKGDLCQLVGTDLNPIAKTCSSCDEGEGHKPIAMQHCGLCTSCLFRRVSIHAAGTDPTRYRDTPTRRHDRYEVAAFEYHAEQLQRLKTFEDLTDLDPNVRFASVAPTELALDIGTMRATVLAMYRRYAEQIRRYLTIARPELRPKPVRSPQEVNRDLFAATR